MTTITKRLQIECMLTEINDELFYLQAGGLTFEFDTNGYEDKWVCTNITVERNARSFESGIFFYADWMEDIYTSFPAIDQFSVQYMLFANCVADKITYDL